VYNKHGGKNQQWNIIYTDKGGKINTKEVSNDYGITAGRPFYIMSRMTMNRVLTYPGGNQMKITSLVNNNEKRQQWKFDATTRTITSLQYP
jgi:hypothetical protein